ncbi:glycosyltransferase family 2 protein [Pseudorhodoferax sp. Leaf267]|uniref:glycosyltransferase family 2 protein n=1 Tax=Pseudorhodoferax sp. Leaf267 TaxID=1736316 RepID=UPI0009EA2468|nr:glycosyltransferase family 2 protein [Pseudorhodoferax sp. Leaf267]
MVGRPVDSRSGTCALPASVVVSVALCTHNGANYLGRQVASICEQTRIPDEIVLSDDASSDASVRVVQSEIAQTARSPIPRLRILRNTKALGITANFEQAVRACNGDVIVLCDQDDVWLPNRVERALAAFSQRPDLLLVHSDAVLIDAFDRPIGRGLFHALEVHAYELSWLHQGRGFNVFLRRNLVTGATAAFRRQLLDSALPFPAGWLHDEWLGAVAATVGQVDVLEEPLIAYRQHGGNAVGARRLTLFELVQRAFAARGQTHIDRARKAEIWLNRLNLLKASGIEVEPIKQQALVQRLAHQKFRAELPTKRLRRIWPIWREVRSGNYARFGRGARGVFRDLFESA